MRKIEAVDFFYLSMPEVTTEGDGSQDALLVRVTAGGVTGWGECEASPLDSIAAFCLPDVSWRLPAGGRVCADVVDVEIQPK
jgi:L-alanine-DL-glutamate epimerase-like enolase superfamily enzyme